MFVGIMLFIQLKISSTFNVILTQFFIKTRIYQNCFDFQIKFCSHLATLTITCSHQAKDLGAII